MKKTGIILLTLIMLVSAAYYLYTRNVIKKDAELLFYLISSEDIDGISLFIDENNNTLNRISRVKIETSTSGNINESTPFRSFYEKKLLEHYHNKDLELCLALFSYYDDLFDQQYKLELIFDNDVRRVDFSDNLLDYFRYFIDNDTDSMIEFIPLLEKYNISYDQKEYEDLIIELLLQHVSNDGIDYFIDLDEEIVLGSNFTNDMKIISDFSKSLTEQNSFDNKIQNIFDEELNNVVKNMLEDDNNIIYIHIGKAFTNILSTSNEYISTDVISDTIINGLDVQYDNISSHAENRNLYAKALYFKGPDRDSPIYIKCKNISSKLADYDQEYSYEIIDKEVIIKTKGNAFVFHEDDLEDKAIPELYRTISKENTIDKFIIEDYEKYFLLVTNSTFFLPNNAHFQPIINVPDYKHLIGYDPDENYFDLKLLYTENKGLSKHVLDLLENYEGLLDQILMGMDYKSVNTLDDIINGTREDNFIIHIVDEIIENKKTKMDPVAYASSFSNEIVIEDLDYKHFNSVFHHEIMHIIDFYYSELFHNSGNIISLNDSTYLWEQDFTEEEKYRILDSGDYESDFTDKYIDEGVLSGYSRMTRKEHLAELWSKSIDNFDEVSKLRNENEVIKEKTDGVVDFINAIYEANDIDKTITFEDLKDFNN